MTRTFAAWGTAVVLAATAPVMAAKARFLPDDPIVREPEPADASGVKPFPIHLSWDLISSVLGKEGDPHRSKAADLNTIDEVPDSSWFTNRIGTRSLTPADVARGPDATNGPVGRWTIVSGKAEGVLPGFTMKDAAGIMWFVKFDAPGYPEQTTGAEVVSTKLFWALGYNVAETHVAQVRRDDLAIAPTATITVRGKRRRMTSADLERILAQVDRSPDGSYRALASKALEGTPLGEFLYYGTRADDPNDIVPHENRRELRGMRVFAAWIDRVDAKAGNTLDTLVSSDGMKLVRHHPLDFGSTLGSAGIAPNDWWEGYEYLGGGTSLSKKLLGFGFPIEQWRTIDYPRLRGVGRFEADHFDPESWRSRVPNAAYVRADGGDTFWAARKLMAMTDSLVAAAVHSGQYSDKAAEEYLTRTLIGRRDAILRANLPALNPVVNPALDDGTLTFENAAVEADVAVAPRAYRATWYTFDNLSDRSDRVGETTSRQTRMNAPDALRGVTASFIRVDISADAAGYPSWGTPLRTYFRRVGRGWTLVGLDRT
jgi:hypothetical protein